MAYILLSEAGKMIGSDDDRLRVPLSRIVAWRATNDLEKQSSSYAGTMVVIDGLGGTFVQEAPSAIDAAFGAA